MYVMIFAGSRPKDMALTWKMKKTLSGTAIRALNVGPVVSISQIAVKREINQSRMRKCGSFIATF